MHRGQDEIWSIIGVCSGRQRGRPGLLSYFGYPYLKSGCQYSTFVSITGPCANY